MLVAGVILAGGGSRRMGGKDKFLMDLGGRPLIGHVIERLEPQVSRLAISANCDPSLLPPGLPVLPDRLPSRGPLSGLRAGLEWAAGLPGVTHVATAAADTPFFPDTLIGRLAASIGARTAALATSGGRIHPTFGLWSVSVLPALQSCLETAGSGRVLDFAGAQDAATVDFTAAGQDPFFNVNEPADLEAARRLARALRG